MKSGMKNNKKGQASQETPLDGFHLKSVEGQWQLPLLQWYRKHKRDLPWRKTKDPYRIWISEIMLQQTQVATVIEYYRRFLNRFPTLQSIAEASEEDLLKLWAGLGYYSRAKNIRKAAIEIVQNHAGVFPKDPQAILALPGIGRYTLGAIASIAFGLPLPVVDGNVIRVYARLFGFEKAPNDPVFQKEIWERAAGNLLRKDPGDFNQALMELGATVCVPQNPLCELCPLEKNCVGKNLGAENFPLKKIRPQTKELIRVALIFQRKNKILLEISQSHRWMKGLWQLPGDFLDNGQRGPGSVFSKFKLSETQVFPLKSHRHTVTHHRITVFPFRVLSFQIPIPNPFPSKTQWFPLSEIDKLALPSADRKILKQIA